VRLKYVSTLKDPTGNIIGGIELFTDISNIHANSLRVLELEKFALLDNLTQLANRRYIERELQVRIEEYKRREIPFGVLFIDIDHFKTVNDTVVSKQRVWKKLPYLRLRSRMR